MKTFVLTIPRLKDRFDKFQERWKGLDYEVFQGIDCVDSPLWLSKTPNKQQAYFVSNLYATVSTWRLMEHCLNFNDEYFWLMEDDAFPCFALPDILQLIEQAKTACQWEVLKLFSLDVDEEKVAVLNKRFSIFRPKDFVSTVSWVVKRDVLIRLIKNTWLTSIDRYVWAMAQNLAIKPNCVGC